VLSELRERFLEMPFADVAPGQIISSQISICIVFSSPLCGL